MDRRPSLCCVRQLDLRPANALVIERLGEGADLGVGETLGRSVRHISRLAHHRGGGASRAERVGVHHRKIGAGPSLA